MRKPCQTQNSICLNIVSKARFVFHQGHSTLLKVKYLLHMHCLFYSNGSLTGLVLEINRRTFNTSVSFHVHMHTDRRFPHRKPDCHHINEIFTRKPERVPETV